MKKSGDMVANARLRLSFGVLLLCFLLSAGRTPAQNVATNPGFETGTTSGWAPFGSPTISVETSQVHSGTYAGLVTNRSATYMGISQSFLGVLQSNQTCAVSVWVQLVNGSSQTVQVEAQKIDGGGTTYATIASGTVSAGAWTQLSGQYTLNYSNSLTGLTFYVQVTSSASAAYYIDDLSVQLVNPTNSACTVDWGTVFQRIDGFGASSAWTGNWTAARADMMFSTNASGTGVSFDGRTNYAYSGCGLSLLRSHINYAGSTTAATVPGSGETTVMQYAQARGARVWSTPWTPAAGFKSTNDIYDSMQATGGGINGGSYLGSANNITNVNYASQLANYVAGMKNSYGVNIYAISLQNEPDAKVNSYEACQWTGQQMHDFVTNLYPALMAKGFGTTKIILPESESWASNTGLFTPTLNDANAAAEFSIIADHDYVSDNVTGDTTTPVSPAISGKTLWETEVSQIGGNFDGGITNAVYWAGRVHLFMTAAQADAWHYWWLFSLNNDNEGLTDTNGVPAKRMYALGQFARFVRPNFYRINVTNNTGSAQISAYKDSSSPNFAIVAINSSLVTVTQEFSFTNTFNISAVTPWMTTSNVNLSSQAAVTVSNASFTYALPALSIVTFAGQVVSNQPPALAAVSNQTINPGVTLVITNVATDADLPPPPLTYSLLSAPTNATLNSTNGVLVWRPSLSQANTTNAISTQVSDNGTPALSATNHFSIVVNPVIQPAISSAGYTNGRMTMLVTGQQGPDYTLLDSSNLVNWQVVATTNSPVPPVLLVDPSAGNYPARFYRLQIGP